MADNDDDDFEYESRIASNKSMGVLPNTSTTSSTNKRMISPFETKLRYNVHRFVKILLDEQHELLTSFNNTNENSNRITDKNDHTDTNTNTNPKGSP